MRSSEGRKTVILVVEDDPLVRMNAMSLVSSLGYLAFEASNADDAILLLEAHAEITIVFTDVQMAGSMDGLALTRWVAGRWPPLRFIIVSGGTSPQIHEMPVGAIFLAKPMRTTPSGDRSPNSPEAITTPTTSVHPPIFRRPAHVQCPSIAAALAQSGEISLLHLAKVEANVLPGHF
ncbi:MAG: hypothetical protein JWR80_5216 [Bradyrhizobium sp.]|nr:hypothetical protein [Bradyrhizobium sp.]